MVSKKIVITGGTGFIGRELCSFFAEQGHDVAVITRNKSRARKKIGSKYSLHEWGTDSLESVVEGAQAIIHLAGENIGSGLWTKTKKQKILSSRVDTGKALVRAVQNVEHKPAVFLQASAVGFYGYDRFDECDEASPSGTGFLSSVTRKWEACTQPIADEGVRRVVTRFGIVLAQGGLFLPRIRLPFLFYMGGHVGDGLQYLSLIHLQDLINAISHLLKNNDAAGIYNISSPQPVTFKEFSITLGNVLKRPSWFHIPKGILRLLLGEMAKETILASNRMIPKKLLEVGYEFRYDDVESALRALYGGKNQTINL